MKLKRNMADEIHKMLFLFCTLSALVIHSINAIKTEILNGEELVGINKTKSVILNKASGHSVLMQCDILSNDFADVTWYKNDTNLINSPRHHISQSYQVPDKVRIFNSRSILKISSLTTDDSGSYSCKLNNTNDSPMIFILTVAPSNALDLLLSGLLILGIIFIFISVIHIIKYIFSRRR